MQLRQAQAEDLGAINAVIRAAVMSWNLPDRVKRLSMDSHCYDVLDLQQYTFLLAEHNEQIIAVAAIDDTPVTVNHQQSLLLHGLYVQPEHHGQGLGQRLFRAVEQLALNRNMHGLFVKAQKDAMGFFEKQQMQKLAVDDTERDYANRYWKSLNE